jgi:hypothetical protein
MQLSHEFLNVLPLYLIVGNGKRIRINKYERWGMSTPTFKFRNHHHHHQPINVPTAGAQACLMDYPQGERAITHHAGLMQIGGC